MCVCIKTQCVFISMHCKIITTIMSIFLCTYVYISPHIVSFGYFFLIFLDAELDFYLP